MYDYTAIGVGIWIRSSVIVLLSLLSIFISIASLIAEELENGTDNKVLNTTIELDEWLEKFHLFNRFVEEMNSCFGLILLLTLSHVLVLSVYYWFRIARKWDSKSFSDESSALPLVELAVCFCHILLLYFRFFVILFGSHELKNKVYILGHYIFWLNWKIEQLIDIQENGLGSCLINRVKPSFCFEKQLQV